MGVETVWAACYPLRVQGGGHFGRHDEETMGSDNWLIWGVALGGFLGVVLAFSLVRLWLQRRAERRASPTEPEAPVEGPALVPEADVTIMLMRRFREKNRQAGVEARLRDEHAFLVEGKDKEPLVVPSLRVYQAYARDPSRLEEIIEHYVDGLIAAFESPDPAELPFSEVRSMILPQLHRVDETVRRERVSIPFGHDLAIGFVLESAHRISVVDGSHLDRWNITADDLQELALTNLGLRSERVAMMREWLDDDNAIYMFESQDGYDAARILLDDLWKQVAADTRGDLYIAIPNRDFLVAFSDHDRESFEGIQRKVLTDYQSQTHPLTWKLFAVTSEGVTPHSFVLH